MNRLFAIFMVFTILFLGPATAGTKPDDKGRKLTGYECARMERLVSSIAEVMGMSRDGMWDTLKIEEKQSDIPEAFRALVNYLNSYNPESLIRSQYELRLDFTKKCAAGKIRAYPVKN